MTEDFKNKVYFIISCMPRLTCFRAYHIHKHSTCCCYLHAYVPFLVFRPAANTTFAMQTGIPSGRLR